MRRRIEKQQLSTIKGCKNLHCVLAVGFAAE